MTKLIKTKSGFTLMEILIALAVFSTLMGTLFVLFSASSRSFTAEGVRTLVQQDISLAMEYMKNDIQVAGLDPSESGAFGIQVANATTIRFTRDSYDTTAQDFNGQIDAGRQEQVTYFLNAATGELQQILDQTFGNPDTVTFMDNVDVANSGFTYFTAGGLAGATPGNIAMVQLQLTIVRDAGRTTEQSQRNQQESGMSRTLVTQIRCRNL